MKRKDVFLILSFAAVVASAASPPASRPPLPTGPAPDLNLVFSSQVIGWIEPCG